MKKLGLSVYENDRTPCRGGKYAVVVDESIFINSEKLLLLLGIPAHHKGEPVKHEDVTVVGIKVGKVFNGDDIKREIEESAKEAGSSPEYIINDQAHNLTNGVAKSGVVTYSNLPKEKQEAYSFVPENKELLDELAVAVDAVRYVEELCKTKGFNISTCSECKHYIIKNVIGNANNRRAKLGIGMLDYFKKEDTLLIDDVQNDNISSDIIESGFGIFKMKKSPNKLYGITPFVLLIPLYPKLVNKSVTDTFNFKERLANVKLKDIDTWAAKNMSTNWVTERTKIFRKAI